MRAVKQVLLILGCAGLLSASEILVAGSSVAAGAQLTFSNGSFTLAVSDLTVQNGESGVSDLVARFANTGKATYWAPTPVYYYYEPVVVAPVVDPIPTPSGWSDEGFVGYGGTPCIAQKGCVSAPRPVTVPHSSALPSSLGSALAIELVANSSARLSPNPEPGTLFLMAGGLLVFGWARHKRRARQ